jgi:hypothetical protein
MPQYRYRQIVVKFVDYGDPEVTPAWQMPEAEPSRYYQVDDSELDEFMTFDIQEDEEKEDFIARADTEFLQHLNTLGEEGWRILYYAPAAHLTSGTGAGYSPDWPIGTHILAREIDQ